MCGRSREAHSRAQNRAHVSRSYRSAFSASIHPILCQTSLRRRLQKHKKVPARSSRNTYLKGSARGATPNQPRLLASGDRVVVGRETCTPPSDLRISRVEISRSSQANVFSAAQRLNRNESRIDTIHACFGRATTMARPTSPGPQQRFSTERCSAIGKEESPPSTQARCASQYLESPHYGSSQSSRFWLRNPSAIPKKRVEHSQTFQPEQTRRHT